jgi:PleD family two-component response regulator
MRILIVDDNEDSRDLNEAALISAGYPDVRTAASAWDAFKLLDIGRVPEQEPPLVDVILLDIVMPEVDGVEACTRIRNDPRYADVPILMVTSLEDVKVLDNAFTAGATDYITKPINRTELVARVRAAHKLKCELERRQARERELLGFVSSWGDRRSSVWVDEATGLFVGEVAEAYLMSTPELPIEGEGPVSIIAIEIDGIENYRSAHGEIRTQNVLANVAHAIRGIAATVGVLAATYRDGTMVLVVPESPASAARKLGETLCSTISQLAIAGSQQVEHVTASVSVVTARVRRRVDRAHLLTHALLTAKAAAAEGGNRVASTQL